MVMYQQLTSGSTHSTHKLDEFCTLTTHASEIFSSLTDTPTDTISIILPKTLHLHATSKAAASVCIANPIDPQTDWRTMASVLRAAETKVLVTVAPCASNTIWQNVEKAMQTVPTITTVIYLDMQRYLSPIERLLTKGVTAMFGWKRLNRNGQNGYLVNCQQFDFDELANQMPSAAYVPTERSRSIQQESLMIRYAV